MNAWGRRSPHEATAEESRPNLQARTRYAFVKQHNPDKLVRLIGTPGAPVVIDVQAERSTHSVPSSIARDPAVVEQWAADLTAISVVVIDEDGRSTAHGVAAWLRTEGVQAEALEGGHAAWQAAGLPLLTLAKLPRRDAAGRTLWVTRARPDEH